MPDILIEARENYLLTVSLSRIVEGGERGLSSLPDSIRKAIKRRIWENIYCEPTKTIVKFNTMREWIEAYQPEGLHTKPAIIEALIRDDSALVIEFKQLMAGSLRKTPGATGLNQHSTPEDKESYYNDNNNSKPSRQGTDPEYLAARIARDHPDIQARIKQGEFKSVRSAAVAAGIVKPRKQFTVGHSTDPRDFAVKLSDELEHDFLVQLVAALNELLDTP
jgi:hypothetical protein